MKVINRVSGILKALGWVIILVSLALIIYVISSDQAEWGKVQKQLSSAGISNGLTDRLHFDDAYFAAMSESQLSDVKATSLRNAAAREHFSYLIELVSGSADKIDAAKAEEKTAYLENEFDFAKFVADFERQGRQEGPGNRGSILPGGTGKSLQ